MATPRNDGSIVMTAQRRLIIDWLNKIGGEKLATPVKGRGSIVSPQECMDEAGYTGSKQAWSSLLGFSENEGIIEREINGRRTLAIRLAPKYRVAPPEPKIAPGGETPEEEPDLPEVPAEEVEPAPSAVGAMPPGGLGVGVLDDFIDGLLLRLLERITTRPAPASTNGVSLPPVDPIDRDHEILVAVEQVTAERTEALHKELDKVKDRLAMALAESQRLRGKFDAAQDAAVAASAQCGQLRRDKRNLEATIDSLKASLKVNDNGTTEAAERRRKETERLMEAPATARGRRDVSTVRN